MRRGFPIILSGPTGSGKTSLCQRIVKEVRGVEYSVSATTRPKRSRERDGRDYHFVDRKTFKAWIREGRFCEWAMVHNHFYGTLREDLEETLSRGKEVVLDLDAQGRKAIRKEYPEGVFVFLLPPNLSALKKRLRKRGTESKEDILNRLKRVEDELKGFEGGDYLVINQDFDRSVESLKTIISAERLRGLRQDFDVLKRTLTHKAKKKVKEVRQ